MSRLDLPMRPTNLIGKSVWITAMQSGLVRSVRACTDSLTVILTWERGEVDWILGGHRIVAEASCFSRRWWDCRPVFWFKALLRQVPVVRALLLRVLRMSR